MQEKSSSVFYVSEFDKKGSGRLVNDCELSGIGLNFLRKVFNIDPNHPDIMVRDMVYDLKITEKEALLLRPYVDFEFDFYRYNYYLQQCSAPDVGSTSNQQ
jgi:hypothetical protein